MPRAGAQSRHNPAISETETTWLLEQRLHGRTVRQISADCPEGIGRPLSPSQVHKRIEKALAKTKEPALAGVRQMELERLDKLEDKMQDILERDNGQAMAATDRLIKIGERRAKLKGLDAPVQVQSETTVEYRIVGVDPEALR